LPLNPFRKRNREHRDKKPRYAEGGPIQGPGAADDDSIPVDLGGRVIIYRSADGREWVIQGCGSEPIYPDWQIKAPGDWKIPDLDWDRTEHDGDDDE
jgi:hypothetical protein